MAHSVAVFSFLVALVFVSTCTMTISQSLPPASVYISLAPSSAPSPAVAAPPLTLKSPPPTDSSPAPSPISFSLTPSQPPTPPSLNAATLNRFSIIGSLVIGTAAAVFIM
ncbi:hypothetical protein ACOSQ2_004959 [Xanthoceras sorbifolium]